MNKVTVSLIKKFLFVFAFIFVLGIALFYLFINPSLFQKSNKYIDSQLSPTLITDKKGIECVKLGGKWMTDPLVGKDFFCNNKMSDGGKICKDNLDCMSNTCIVDESDNVAKCANYKNIYGCYTRLMRGTRLNRSKGDIVREGICVD